MPRTRYFAPPYGPFKALPLLYASDKALPIPEDASLSQTTSGAGGGGAGRRLLKPLPEHIAPSDSVEGTHAPARPKMGAARMLLNEEPRDEFILRPRSRQEENSSIPPVVDGLLTVLTGRNSSASTKNDDTNQTDASGNNSTSSRYDFRTDWQWQVGAWCCPWGVSGCPCVLQDCSIHDKVWQDWQWQVGNSTIGVLSFLKQECWMSSRPTAY